MYTYKSPHKNNMMDRSLDPEDEAPSFSNMTLEEAVDRQHEEGSIFEGGCGGILNTASRTEMERSSAERSRALNRLSKARCRKRRKDLLKTLEADIARLSSEHNSLRAENEQLRQEFTACVGANTQPPMMTSPTRAETIVSNPVGHESIFTDAFLLFLHGSFTNNLAPQGVGRAQDLLRNSVTYNTANLGLHGHQAITLSAIAELLSNFQSETAFPPNDNELNES
jgi:hypothetical protein